MTDTEKRWVYDGVEVIKTGRKAQRTLQSGKLDVQIEVTPINSTVGSWKKWVRENELFLIDGDDE